MLVGGEGGGVDAVGDVEGGPGFFEGEGDVEGGESDGGGSEIVFGPTVWWRVSWVARRSAWRSSCRACSALCWRAWIWATMRWVAPARASWSGGVVVAVGGFQRSLYGEGGVEGFVEAILGEEYLGD